MAGRFARPLLRWSIIFTLFCHLYGRHSGQTGRNLFVSLSGKDSKMCGSPDMPCRTIGRAVQQGTWGDTIYLDGTGTEQQPYNCPVTTYDISGIHVTKSLSIIGFSSVAHVSCTSGVFFTKLTGRENMLVKLSNIDFRGTAVIFCNCSAQIEGCIFRDTFGSSAIGFKAGGIPRNVSLVITNASFTNNSLCIAADFSDVSELNVLIDVQNTRFQGNGLVTSPSGTGGILLSNSSKSEGVMQVRVRCSNVSYVKNRGSFMTVDLVTAITDESYINMTIAQNGIHRVYRKNFLQGVLNSLYCAQTKKSKFVFTYVRCVNNTNARCVGISSGDLSLKIRDSLFSGQELNSSHGGAVFIARPEGSVDINLENTDFVRNSAQEGGCIYVGKGNGVINLDVFNVTFNQCLAYNQGSALIVGGSQGREPNLEKGIRKLFANIRNMRVLKCTLPTWRTGRFAAICLHIKEAGEIKFDHVVWVGNSASGCSALLVGITQGTAQITINNSLLVKNTGYFGNLCTVSLVPEAGTVTILNTRIINAENNGMALDPSFRISLLNVTVTSCYHAALVIMNRVWHSEPNSNVTVNITDCTFKHNGINMQCKLVSDKRVTFTAKNSVFSGPVPKPKPKPKPRRREKPEIYSFLFVIDPLQNRRNEVPVVVSLENVTFSSATSFLLSVKQEAKLRMRVKGSTFKNCTILCLHKRSYCDPREVQYGGAVTILLGPDQSEASGCTSHRAKKNIHPTWKYTKHIVFEDTVFEGNEGLAAGAVYLENGHASFTRCSFKNNFALWRGGHVTVAPGSGRVDLISSTFNQTTAISRRERKVTGPQFSQFLYSETFGQINITNTSMNYESSSTNPQPVFDIAQGGFVFIEQDSHIKCSVGSKLTLENLTHLSPIKYTCNKTCKMNLTILRYSCGMCSPGMYSLQKGSSSGLFVQRGFQCLFCPYGADCTRNIVAKPDFWGYRVSTHLPYLNFTSCPEEYCSPPRDSPPSVYNGCHGNRAGVLCGTCRHGYTESLFSTECRPVEECSQIWFWFGAAIVVICFTLFLVKKPPVFAFLYRHIFWFRQQSSEHQAFGKDLGPSQHSDSGYLKITFYFYQVADLLLVGSLIEVARRVPFVLPVVGLFKLQIQSFDEGIGCPFAGLTAVTKELFMSLGPFAVITCVFAIYAVHRLINLIRGCERPNVIHYLAVALETLLLGYERLAETALKLLHCLPLGSEWRLFYDGNIVCWQWWQTVVLLYILVFLVPFIGVLYWGSFLLHANRISFKEFLGACVLPVPFLIRWAMLYLTGRLKDQIPEECIGEEVLEVLHGPFRAPSNQDAGSLYWESVLIGRRFILLSLSAFIVDPMVRLACMTGACVLMAFHHVIKRPYRELTANRVETASLLLLVLLGVVNLARASFQSAGTDPGGPTVAYFVAFRCLEVTCLALAPCLVVLLTIFAVLSQLLRLIIFLFSRVALLCRDVRLLRQNGNDQRKPLLSPAERQRARFLKQNKTKQEKE